MDREIRFKPLTDGLGFHPFEDGLPYAPASKKQSTPTTGAGATAAGRAQFAYPPSAAAANPSPKQPSYPQAPPRNFATTNADITADKIRRELEAIQSQRLEQARTTASRIHKPLEIHFGLGYSFERAFAFVLDSAFNLSICASILSTALMSADLDQLKTLTSGASIAVVVFLFLCNWALLAAQEVAFGTTIGKRIFGLRLNGSGFECFIRSVLFMFSLLFGGLGILMAIFDSKKRCWHDRMTKIQPT